MKIQRVLVVYRKSLYQIYVKEHKERSISSALRRRDEVALKLKRTHETHLASLAEIQRILKRRKIEAVVRWRAKLRSLAGYDLVISLGGDGTLLDISHRLVTETPLLGVNSDPQKSVGALCVGTVQALEDHLDGLEAGTLRPLTVTRLRIRVDGVEVLGPTLNDVLFAHHCPAGLSRFEMAIVPAAEAERAHSGRDLALFDHVRGSGLWVSSATGSTAAIRSAGGRIMATRSRQLQYVIREPYRLPPYTADRPARGMVAPDQALVLVSRMRRGQLWADGCHRSAAVEYSQQVIIDRHPVPLRLVRV